MRLETARFGVLDYEKTDIIWMVRGFLGFEDLKRFVFISPKEQEPFKWYQSLENPDIAFLLIEPRFLKPDYVVDINPKDISILGAKSRDDITYFLLVTIPGGKPQMISANLKAPLAINPKNNQGAQLVLGDSGYHAAHPIFGKIDKRPSHAPPAKGKA